MIRSLGAVGDAAVLDELEGLPPPSHVAERKQLVLAKALISHRLGRPERHLPDSRGVPRQPGVPEEMVALTLRPEAAQAIRFALGRLVGATYDVTIGDRGFGLLQAGKARRCNTRP
ncbi:MAG TPA: hypothetical protein VFA46_03140 [Actinomycetes bacterium]|nr:hypothetical protein [Actinomycetes bacterium]